MDTSVLNINDVESKSVADKLIEIIKNSSLIDDSCSVAADFVLAVKTHKNEAVTVITEALKKSNVLVVAINPSTLFFSGDIFGTFKFYQRSKYSTVYCQFWTESEENKKDFIAWANSLFKDDLMKGAICGVRWAYSSSHGLSSSYLEELLTDVVIDEAYPLVLNKYGSLNNFAKKYLESDESVLVLQGPPGTGKSRLIRFLMAQLAISGATDREGTGQEIDTNNRNKSLILYTSDTNCMQSDELFAMFMMSDELMFVVEDADNMLRSREKGNDHLHRFLTVSDGIIRNVGRKVVFTTNLPNMHDIDSALLRPGRCFDALSLKGFEKQEALNFAEKLSEGNKNVLAAVYTFFEKNRNMTLAEVYKVWKTQNR